MSWNGIAAIAFLTVIVLLPVAVFVYWRRRYGITAAQAFLYLATRLFTRFLWRTRVLNPLPVADDQGAILICNHRSSVDPWFLQVKPRTVHWMVAKEFFRHGVIGWFLHATRSIPVGRGGVDTAATKQAIRYATAGGLIGMFPEGRINTTDDFMLPGRPGAVLVALRAGVPIVPCYIDGAPYDKEPWSPLVRRARVTVRFGEPIQLPDCDPGDTDQIRAIFLDCLRRIAQLAERHDFEPQVAGRRWKPAKSN